MKRNLILIALFLGASSFAFCAYPMFELEEDDYFAHQMHDAIKKKDEKRALKLSSGIVDTIDTQDRKGNTLLGYAIESGDTRVVDDLLLKGANPNGETHGKSPLLLAAEGGKSQILESLLLHKAKDKDHYELFHHAIRAQSIPMIHALAREGFDINAVALDYTFPLVDAVATRNLDIIKACVLLGADTEMTDDELNTALDLLRREMAKKAPGQRIPRRIRKEAGDLIDDHEIDKATDEEIITLLEECKFSNADRLEQIRLDKFLASELAKFRIDEAIHRFERYKRDDQKAISPFLSLQMHRKMQEKQLQKIREAMKSSEPGFIGDDYSGFKSSTGGGSLLSNLASALNLFQAK